MAPTTFFCGFLYGAKLREAISFFGSGQKPGRFQPENPFSRHGQLGVSFEDSPCGFKGKRKGSQAETKRKPKAKPLQFVCDPRFSHTHTHVHCLFGQKIRGAHVQVRACGPSRGTGRKGSKRRGSTVSARKWPCIFRVGTTKAIAWLLLGNVLHFCLLWFSGKSPLNC